MPKDHFITVAIHFSIYAAKGSSNWAYIFKTLAKILVPNGCAQKTVKKNVILFTFFHPTTAFLSVIESLHFVKNKYVDRDYGTSLPFKIIFHIEDNENDELPIAESSNELWNYLEFGHFYVSKYLKDYLDQNSLWKDLPEHAVKSTENMKIFELIFNNPSQIYNKPLFSARSIPLQSESDKICYYCGMSQHKPTECPSRHMTMETQGLLDIGFLTFDQINETFEGAFSNFFKLADCISADLTPEKSRASPPLMALLAYFDVFRVFQLRFFAAMFLSSGMTWPQLGKKTEIVSKNTTLQIGFDSLLDGKFQEAEDKFSSEASKATGELFYAHIGLAFVALEQEKDMGNPLATAIGLASSSEEKIYGYLLLSRHYETIRENNKAETMMHFIDKLDFVCSDADYRGFQIAAKQGLTVDQAKKFQTLIAQRELYMASLIDPSFSEVTGIVDSLLLYVLQRNIKSARANYLKASTAYSDLMLLVDEKEEIHEKLEKTINDLEQLLNEKKYFKILGASKKAKNACTLCNNLTEKINHEIKQRKTLTKNRLARLRKFWQTYPLKSYFKKFNEDLLRQQKKFDAIDASLEKGDKSNSFKESKIKLAEIENGLKELEERKQKMLELKKTMDLLAAYGKNLLFAECFMAFIGVLLLIILAFIAGENPFNDPLGSITPSGKRIMFFLLGLIAPATALILTAHTFLAKKK